MWSVDDESPAFVGGHHVNVFRNFAVSFSLRLGRAYERLSFSLVESLYTCIEAFASGLS